MKHIMNGECTPEFERWLSLDEFVSTFNIQGNCTPQSFLNVGFVSLWQSDKVVFPVYCDQSPSTISAHQEWPDFSNVILKKLREKREEREAELESDSQPNDKHNTVQK